ncbi:hypothetical protein ACVXHA_00680 [Escherichia coli]
MTVLLVQGDTNDLPVTINADHAKGTTRMTPCLLAAWISCRVTAVCRPTKCSSIKRGTRTTVVVRTVDALGNVHYDDNQVHSKGRKAGRYLTPKIPTSGKVITRWWVAWLR